MSSKRRLRRKECGSKHKHADRGGAITHIKRLEAGGKVSGVLGAYQCKHCGFWHVGHSKGSRRTFTLTRFLRLAK